MVEIVLERFVLKGFIFQGSTEGLPAVVKKGALVGVLLSPVNYQRMGNDIKCVTLAKIRKLRVIDRGLDKRQ